MKKTLFLTIGLYMILLSGCITTPSEDVISVSETLIMRGDSTFSGSIMNGETDTFSGQVQLNPGKQEVIAPVKDIVGQTIPENQDIGQYLSEYLAGEGFTGKIIGKKLSRENVIALSMGDISVEGRCADYMITNCINFIIKNREVVYFNLKSLLDKTNLGDGEVYRFTKNGVLFRFGGGEGVACEGGGADRFTYINLDNMQLLYSVLSWKNKGVSPNLKDSDCESKNTKWTKTETLKFFKSNEDWNDETKALPIQANTTEEAFYKYYNLQ